jgi:hypothetical protein
MAVRPHNGIDGGTGIPGSGSGAGLPVIFNRQASLLDPGRRLSRHSLLATTPLNKLSPDNPRVIVYKSFFNALLNNAPLLYLITKGAFRDRKKSHGSASVSWMHSSGQEP